MLSAKYRKFRHFETNAIVPMITEVCKALGKYSSEAVALVLETAAAESSMIHRVQIGGGPARGLWQMEPDTAVSLFENYLQYRGGLYWKLIQIWFDISAPMSSTIPVYMKPTRDEDIAYHLENDDVFACAMARIKYLPVQAAIPITPQKRAVYWKQSYNTPAGDGTIEHYLKQREACQCEELLMQAGLERAKG